MQLQINHILCQGGRRERHQKSLTAPKPPGKMQNAELHWGIAA
jgi:hypothetical protein